MTTAVAAEWVVSDIDGGVRIAAAADGTEMVSAEVVQCRGVIYRLADAVLNDPPEPIDAALLARAENEAVRLGAHALKIAVGGNYRKFFTGLGYFEKGTSHTGSEGTQYDMKKVITDGR
ncbi:MAG: hypothetical protein WDN27_00285 [Candidatus Saccharibacteria bacterium]